MKLQLTRFNTVSQSLISKYPKFILIAFFIAFFFLSVSHYNNNAQALIAYATVLFFITALVFKFTQRVRLILLILALLVSWRYIFWRMSETIIYSGFFDIIGTILLLIAELYGIVISSFGIFTSLNLLDRKPIDISNIPIAQLPSVDVMIPTYNEDFDIVIDTALAASMMNYPDEKLRICILDDGGTEQK